MLQLDPMSFVSPYYLKEVVLNTWTGEMWGFQAIGNFNRVNPAERWYIPNPSLVRTNRGIDDSAGTLGMILDESEAGGRQSNVSCAICGAIGTTIVLLLGLVVLTSVAEGTTDVEDEEEAETRVRLCISNNMC
jgi:hypothetical protein